MKTEHIIYAAYMGFFLLLVGSAFLVPILAFNQDMSAAYNAFGYTCHQKISRSICIFSDGKIGDCTPQTGTYVNTRIDRATIKVENGSVSGYKIPVCARDVGIYGALLLGGLIYPFVKKMDNRHVYPAIFLILAILPLGLDGTIQLLSEFGFLPFVYESTNLVRLLTGSLAGFVSAFYAIPILMNMFGSGSMRSQARDLKQNKTKKS